MTASGLLLPPSGPLRPHFLLPPEDAAIAGVAYFGARKRACSCVLGAPKPRAGTAGGLLSLRGTAAAVRLELTGTRPWTAGPRQQSRAPACPVHSLLARCCKAEAPCSEGFGEEACKPSNWRFHTPRRNITEIQTPKTPLFRGGQCEPGRSGALPIIRAVNVARRFHLVPFLYSPITVANHHPGWKLLLEPAPPGGLLGLWRERETSVPAVARPVLRPVRWGLFSATSCVWSSVENEASAHWLWPCGLLSTTVPFPSSLRVSIKQVPPRMEDGTSKPPTACSLLFKKRLLFSSQGPVVGTRCPRQRARSEASG